MNTRARGALLASAARPPLRVRAASKSATHYRRTREMMKKKKVKRYSIITCNCFDLLVTVLNFSRSHALYKLTRSFIVGYIHGDHICICLEHTDFMRKQI
jgi:hypothetical protein